MTEHPDVILYLLFESIREDWSNGIEDRGNAIIDIVPHTSFNKKDEMIHLMIQMINGWNSDTERFDGRYFARDGLFCYYTLFQYFNTLENLNSTKLLKWGKGINNTDRMEGNWELLGGCHDDVMLLYNEWLEETKL